MTFWSHISQMLNGISGKPEAGRTLWAGGSGMYIIVTPLFQLIDIMKNNAHFDPLAFSTGYGSGLAAVLGVGGLAIATKDKGVAKANQIASSPPATVVQGDLNAENIEHAEIGK